jgi:uncharacterized membrane protein YkgB
VNGPFNKSWRSIPGVLTGVGCLALAVGPLLLFGVLQSLFGLFAGSNGLGLGLWFFFTTPVAAIILIVGAVMDSRRHSRGRRA